MLDIVIVAIGKIKEKNYKEMFDEYIKRLAPYARMRVEELKAESFASEAGKNKAKNIESGRVINFLEKYSNDSMFVLSEHGKQYSSEEFSSLIGKSETNKLVFVVFGTLGPNKNILDKYKNVLSLSKMTFPHELARVMLAEQIYRGVTIMKKKKYHY